MLASRARNIHVERRQYDMNLVPELIHSVETPVRAGIAAGHVIAVVGKILPGGQARRFADDFVAFNHQPGTVRMQHDPFAAEQGDRAIRAVANRDEVDERVWFVRRQAGATMMVAQFVERGGQAGEFGGAGHAGKEMQ